VTVCETHDESRLRAALSLRNSEEIAKAHLELRRIRETRVTLPGELLADPGNEEPARYLLGLDAMNSARKPGAGKLLRGD
jgi:hypothetical protein